MARLSAFERDLEVATADLSLPEIKKALAKTAIETRDELIQNGEASPLYTRYVNDQEGLPEEDVLPPGSILYEFDYQREIAEFALKWAHENSPTGSGAYRDAWFVLADGAQVDPEQIPAGADFYITNDRPYARKIAVGAQKVSVPPGIVERLRQIVMARYGNFVSVEVEFIELSGGYILKGRRPRKAAAQNRRSSAFRAGRKQLKSRKDTAAGQPMRYPSILVSQK